MPKAKTTFTIMIAAIIAACIAPASASADCLTAMIVDHSAAALLRYESCRNVEGRLQALEQAERDRQETRRAPEWAPRPNALSALYEGYAQSRTVTKAEFEEAKRHLFPESTTAEFQDHVNRCVRERTEFYQHRRPIEQEPAACNGLTPAEKLDAALQSASELSRMIGLKNAGVPTTHRVVQ